MSFRGFGPLVQAASERWVLSLRFNISPQEMLTSEIYCSKGNM